MSIPMTRASLKLLVMAAGAALATATTLAAAQAPTASPQERYQAERAACLSGNTSQDRTTCLREAGAALHDANQSRQFDSGAPAQYQRNAEMRCSPLPPDQRQSCLLRMEGQGRTSGSVAGGGIYRELHQIVPADDPNAAVPSRMAPDAAAPRPAAPTTIIIIPDTQSAPSGDRPYDQTPPARPVLPAQ